MMMIMNLQALKMIKNWKFSSLLLLIINDSLWSNIVKLAGTFNLFTYFLYALKIQFSLNEKEKLHKPQKLKLIYITSVVWKFK